MSSTLWQSLLVLAVWVRSGSELPVNAPLPSSWSVDGELSEKSVDYATSKAESSAKPLKPSVIQNLMDNPALMRPVRVPRNPIVLCHGLYGFDVWGPSGFQRHYWSEVLDILRKKIGAEVIVTSVPGTGSIEERGRILDTLLKEKATNRRVNFMAHSMGGLDCRQVITHIKPTAYTPLSLTTVATPHRGSPFMDWCNVNIGIGTLQDVVERSRFRNVPYSLKSPILSAAQRASRSTSTQSLLNYLTSLPQSVTTLILSLVDTPAYSNLTTAFLNDHFNPRTPDVEGVRYFSVAGRVKDMSIFHPLWLPKLIVDRAEEVERQSELDHPTGERWPESTIGRVHDDEMGNDGLVSVASARWGEFLGVVEECDHWDLRGGGGFSAQWELAGESGDRGWIQGIDWSKWGKVWLGGGKATAAASRQMKQKRESPSDIMTWIGEQMAKATTEKNAKAIAAPPPLKRIAPPLQEPDITKQKKNAIFDLERLYIALTRKLYEEGL